MFILTINGREKEGAYSVTDDDGEQIIYLFEEEDDATRYALMLEDQEEQEMDVVEVDAALAIRTCKMYNYKYTVITPNDIVVPPKNVSIS